MKKALKYPIVVDGRNLFNPAKMAAAGFHYYSIGRPDVMAAMQITAQNGDAKPMQPDEQAA
jgi:hypothetical protein